MTMYWDLREVQSTGGSWGGLWGCNPPPLGLLTESVISDAQTCQTSARHSLKAWSATTLQPIETVTVYMYTLHQGGVGQLTALSQYLWLWYRPAYMRGAVSIRKTGLALIKATTRPTFARLHQVRLSGKKIFTSRVPFSAFKSELVYRTFRSFISGMDKLSLYTRFIHLV